MKKVSALTLLISCLSMAAAGTALADPRCPDLPSTDVTTTGVSNASGLWTVYFKISDANPFCSSDPATCLGDVKTTASNAKDAENIAQQALSQVKIAGDGYAREVYAIGERKWVCSIQRSNYSLPSNVKGVKKLSVSVRSLPLLKKEQ